MRYTKDEFVKAVCELQELDAYINSLEALLKCSLTESPLKRNWQNQLDTICTLSDVDKNANWNDIEYFVIELDYGRKWHPGSVIIDDEDTPMRTPEELYDILVMLQTEKANENT